MHPQSPCPQLHQGHGCPCSQPSMETPPPSLREAEGFAKQEPQRDEIGPKYGRFLMQRRATYFKGMWGNWHFPCRNRVGLSPQLCVMSQPEEPGNLLWLSRNPLLPVWSGLASYPAKMRNFMSFCSGEKQPVCDQFRISLKGH